MKKCLIILGFVAFCSCEKEHVSPSTVEVIPCVISDSVSFQQEIYPILSDYCMPCHSNPGAGGVNFDTYSEILPFALSGQLVHTLIHDTTGIIMPPLPSNGPDSCQVKAIKRWIAQGALNN
ncbi:MAG: hypothetical protein ACKOXP_08080 [Flavobacteriales bacterium]